MKKIIKSIMSFFVLFSCMSTMSACGDCYHTYGNWTIVKYATCTEDGKKEHECTKCGHTEFEKIYALGHNYVGGICTDCGAKQ